MQHNSSVKEGTRNSHNNNGNGHYSIHEPVPAWQRGRQRKTSTHNKQFIIISINTRKGTTKPARNEESKQDYQEFPSHRRGKRRVGSLCTIWLRRGRPAVTVSSGARDGSSRTIIVPASSSCQSPNARPRTRRPLREQKQERLRYPRSCCQQEEERSIFLLFLVTFWN
jgi:hypothetical protein